MGLLLLIDLVLNKAMGTSIRDLKYLNSLIEIVGRLDLPYSGDEVHHTGWNACSSCHGDPSHQRSHLVAPSLNSSRIYFINACDPRNLKVDLVDILNLL